VSSVSASSKDRRPIPWVHYLQNAVLYLAVVVIFGPIFWLILTSFKTDAAAYALPPQILFIPTFEQYTSALQSFWAPFFNSLFIVGVSTLICLLLGIPAAFALSYFHNPRNESIVFWFITTKALPLAAVLTPLFVIFRSLRLLDTPWALIIVFTGMNTPIVVWMMYQFMKDLPRGIMEAAQVDGVNLFQMLMRIVIPLTRAGIASTAMLCVIFSWNEFLFSVSFTAIEWQPLSVAVAAQQTSRGQFWAQLSAFTTLAILVPVIVGWLTQKQLVRGLTTGAVK
jgi:sorbitol/mannitol transport system permease protein